MTLLFAYIFISVLLALANGFKLDIIGFYGNSGSSPVPAPVLDDIPCYYNVIIITFLHFNGQDLVLQMGRPYGSNTEDLKADILAWKAKPDPYGRRKRVMVSLGGAGATWPDDISSAQIESQLKAFLEEYSLDGLDIDLEGSALVGTSDLVPVLVTLKEKGYDITASPLVASSSLAPYDEILASAVTYYHPQFYNSPPFLVFSPYNPPTVNGLFHFPPLGWQDPTPSSFVGSGKSWWVNVLDAINSHANLDDSKRGLLVPASKLAATLYNNWDFVKLASSIVDANVTHVGTWAIAYDKSVDYAFSKAMASTMGDLKC